MTGWVERLRWWARKKWVSWGIALVLTTPLAFWLLRSGWRDAVSFDDQRRGYDTSELADALADLKSPSAEERSAGLKFIIERAKQPLNSGQTAALIRASTIDELKPEDLPKAYDRILIQAAGAWLTASSARTLTEHYPRLSDAARFEALAALRKASIPYGTDKMLNLMREHGYPPVPRPLSELLGSECVSEEVQRDLTDGSIRGVPDGAADELRRTCDQKR